MLSDSHGNLKDKLESWDFHPKQITVKPVHGFTS